MTTENFAVKVGEFEGPMELLLNLVTERKLAISEISLAAVTEDFIAYLEQAAGTQPMTELADFVLVASTLMLIKSRALLPELALTEEEITSVHDLELRLKIYQRLKLAEPALATRFASTPRQLSGYQRPFTPIFSPPANLTPTLLRQLVGAVLTSLPQVTTLPQVAIKKILTLEEAMEKWRERIQHSLSLTFRQHVTGASDRGQIIVNFLSLLELVKRGLVAVEQASLNADIHIAPNAPSIPSYR